jgi:type IV pilus assembly protein PilX
VTRRRSILSRFGHSGIALPIVLMILLAITGLALFSARYATLGERSARNQLDSERARQAAESALRDAERDILLETGAQLPGAPCARGVSRPDVITSEYQATCPKGQCDGLAVNYSQANWSSGSDAEPWWPEDKGGRWNNDFANKPRRGSSANCSTFLGGVPLGTYTGVASISGVARQPEYLIEFIPRGNFTNVIFRITARGFGASEQTQIVMQSYFRPYD